MEKALALQFNSPHKATRKVTWAPTPRKCHKCPSFTMPFLQLFSLSLDWSQTLSCCCHSDSCQPVIAIENKSFKPFKDSNVRHQAYVADNKETHRSYTETSCSYFANNCHDNIYWLGRQPQFVGNSSVCHLHIFLVFTSIHKYFIGGYLTSQS